MLHHLNDVDAPRCVLYMVWFNLSLDLTLLVSLSFVRTEIIYCNDVNDF